MKKLFFLSLILTGMGSAVSAQAKLKRTPKKQPSEARVAEKMRLESQSSAQKAAPKKTVVVTPRAEVMVTKEQN